MIITAVVVGTRGDVNPLVDLGVEMLRRGHVFRILAMEMFRPLIEGKGVTYLHLDGEGEHVMRYLVTDYKRSIDFFIGMLKLKRENPGFMEQTAAAVEESDLVRYGTCSGFAYHACELFHKPCVRFFYSPFDRTEMYSLYTRERNTPAVAKSYDANIDGLNLMTILMMNKWRKSAGLPKWRKDSDYRVLGGRKSLTFYPVSTVLMPRDPKWGEHIHVTGYWYHPQEDAEAFVPDKELCSFLEKGEKPIFVGFGKAQSRELAQLQKIMLEALRETGIRAVVQADQLTQAQRQNTDRLFFVGNLPYSWIFPRVKAVAHHGGCTTNGLGLYYGCPTLVIPLALDQYYYGRAIHEAGAGPEPLYIRKRLCTKEELKRALTELADGRYKERARELAALIRQEKGCTEAADCIEAYVSSLAANGNEGKPQENAPQ